MKPRIATRVLSPIRICPACEIALSHFPFQQTTSRRTIPIANARRAFVPNLVSPVKYGAGWSRMDLCRILRTNASQWIIALPVISITLFFLTSGFHYKCNLPPSSSHFPLLLRFDPCRIINFYFAHFFPFHPFVYPPFNYPAQRDLSSPLDFRSFLRKKRKKPFCSVLLTRRCYATNPEGRCTLSCV